MQPDRQPDRRRVKWRRFTIAAVMVATLILAGVAASAQAPTIDWDDPTVTVTYPGGWTAAVCGPQVSIICVERHGVAAGGIDVGAGPLSSIDIAAFDPNQPRTFLRALVDEFIADTTSQRLSVCGSDYEVHPAPTRSRNVLGKRGVSFGFSGNFAGEPTSELIIIHMAVVDDHVVFITASAHDPTSCEAGEEVFTVEDLQEFQGHLPKLVRHLPTPEFVFPPPAL